MHKIHLFFLCLSYFFIVETSDTNSAQEEFVPYTTEKYFYNKTVELRPITDNLSRTIETDTTSAHVFDWGCSHEKTTSEIEGTYEKITKEVWTTRNITYYPTVAGSIVILLAACIIEFAMDYVKQSK